MESLLGEGLNTPSPACGIPEPALHNPLAQQVMTLTSPLHRGTLGLMRVLIAYPPLKSTKGSPMLTQNRQFQWFHEPSYLYPCVPASAASLLQEDGHQVAWCDAHAENKSWAQFEKLLRDFEPELILLETKSPVVRQYWSLIDDIKEIVPGTRCVMMGDHVTGNPRETMEQSNTDYAFVGGDWDFLAQNLCNHLEKGEALAGGVWHKENSLPESTGDYTDLGDLDALPFIDRDLTNAHLYFEKWKKRLPFMWTMAGRDCPYGRCTFCSCAVQKRSPLPGASGPTGDLRGDAAGTPFEACVTGLAGAFGARGPRRMWPRSVNFCLACLRRFACQRC